jgi:DNA-binding response OmpR family regulator
MMSVLITDPDPETRTLLELLVRRLGHRPLVPADLASGEEPELVLLEPASEAALEQIRALRSRIVQLPIVCVTTLATSPEADALQPAAYLVKPFTRSELERAFHAALGFTETT